MWRSALLLALAVALTEPAAAIVYRCRTVTGTLFFTDDPGYLPPGCRTLSAIEAVAPLPGFPPPPLPADTETVAPQNQQPAERNWLAAARDLLARYRQAQANRVSSLPPTTVQRALAELRQIEKQTASFLQDLRNSPLPSREQEEIRGLLAPIPAPES